ncbi:MAG: B12-binding domain-containing radical SAM protein, partial [Pyrinomonadaceae bacterium]
MKVLLVYPEFPDTYWSFRHALSFEKKLSAFPPLGLMTISAMLPAAWERRLVDMSVKPLKQADLEWADLVFASAMIVQKDSLRRVVDQCKKLGKPVAIGGPF